MPKMRVRASKPNHGGGYNQGRKMGKERNHTHQLLTKKKINGQLVELCSIPNCKRRNLIHT